MSRIYTASFNKTGGKVTLQIKLKSGCAGKLMVSGANAAQKILVQDIVDSSYKNKAKVYLIETADAGSKIELEIEIKLKTKHTSFIDQVVELTIALENDCEPAIETERSVELNYADFNQD